MASNFENPIQRTSLEEEKKQITSKAALNRAVEKTKKFIDTELAEEITQRLKEKPTVHLNGIDWKLSEMPGKRRAAYEQIAVAQKKLEALDAKLEDVVKKNGIEADPNTAEEAASYFQVQVLGNLHEYQASKADHMAKAFGLKLQHPDLFKALDSNRN